MLQREKLKGTEGEAAAREAAEKDATAGEAIEREPEKAELIVKEAMKMEALWKAILEDIEREAIARVATEREGKNENPAAAAATASGGDIGRIRRRAGYQGGKKETVLVAGITS